MAEPFYRSVLNDQAGLGFKYAVNAYGAALNLKMFISSMTADCAVNVVAAGVLKLRTYILSRPSVDKNCVWDCDHLCRMKKADLEDHKFELRKYLQPPSVQQIFDSESLIMLNFVS